MSQEVSTETLLDILITWAKANGYHAVAAFLEDRSSSSLETVFDAWNNMIEDSNQRSARCKAPVTTYSPRGVFTAECHAVVHQYEHGLWRHLDPTLDEHHAPQLASFHTPTP